MFLLTKMSLSVYDLNVFLEMSVSVIIVNVLNGEVMKNQCGKYVFRHIPKYFICRTFGPVELTNHKLQVHIISLVLKHDPSTRLHKLDVLYIFL